MNAGATANAPGVTPPSRVDRQGVFLTDVLVELGFADQGSVQKAVEATRQSLRTPERYLLENGVIDERQLALALAERNGLDHVDLDMFEVDPEATGLINKSTAARYGALPVAFGPDGALIVAFEDPHDMLGISDIEVIAKSEVRPVVAAGTQIYRLIESLPERLPVPSSQSPKSMQPGPSGERRGPPPDPARATTVAEEPQPAPVPEPQPEPAPIPGPPPIPEPTPVVAGDDPGQLAATLAALQDRARQAIVLAEATERRIAELEDFDIRAQQAAETLAHERARFEKERLEGSEREQDLRRELTEAMDRITTLERNLDEVGAVAELARAVTEKLATLSSTADLAPPQAEQDGS